MGGIGVIPLHKTNRKGKPVFQDLPLCYALLFIRNLKDYPNQ